MARRAGAPGAKTERAWRHGGPGLRAWRRPGRLQCAVRRLQLFSVRWAPSSAIFSAPGAIFSLLACWRRQRQMA